MTDAEIVRLFALRRPCDDCPFLIEGGIRLQPRRTFELLQSIERDHKVFHCHKTVDDSTDESDATHAVYGAGSMIYLQHHRRPHLGMRLGASWGYFDPARLDMAAPVFRTPAVMLRAQVRAERHAG